MKKSIVPLVAAILGGIIAFGFQNCSAPKSATVAAAIATEEASALGGGSGAALDPLQIPEAEISSVIEAYKSSCLGYTMIRPADMTVVANGRSFTTALTDTAFYVGAQIGTVTVNGTFNFLGSIDGGGATVAKLKLGGRAAGANICNANVNLASGVGDLAVNGGTLAAIDGLTGNIVIIGGDIPATIKNMTGNIYARTKSGQLKGRRFF